jgi:hypothetical protein
LNIKSLFRNNPNLSGYIARHEKVPFEVQEVIKKRKLARFFQMTSRLPLEMQTIICNFATIGVERVVHGSEIDLHTKTIFEMFEKEKTK